MKKLIFVLFVLLPLLIGVTQVRAEQITVGGVTVTETITYEKVSPNAVCKSGSHKISFRQDGIEIAWTKLSGVNACWSACGVKIDNSTRSHWALPGSGWWWRWGTALLGGRPCGSTVINKWTNDELHGPNKRGYLTYQEMWLKWLDPLDFNWSWSSTPVVWP